MANTTCNLCGSPQRDPFVQLQDFLLDRPHVHAKLVRCGQCGLVYQDPRPSLEEMDQHYPPEYDSFHPQAQKGQASWLLRQAVQYGIQKRTRFVTRYQKAGRLLDIGCATGVFLQGMSQVPGWQVEGVELNSQAAQEARNRFGLQVFTGTLEAARYPDERFDAVTMWDVLEHLHDPAGTLEEIHRVLKPGGLIVVRVPNLASWDSRFFGRAWAGLDAPRHLFVFDPRTLERMLSGGGFQILDRSCRIGGYPTFALSVRFWMVARGVAAARRDRVMRILYHPLLRLATAPIFFLSSLGLRGPLLVVTARKGATSGA